MTKGRALCPSAPAGAKARLIGVVTSAGQVAFLGTPRPVDHAFLDAADEGREAERRFRFTAPCAERGCANWDQGGCALPGRIAADLASAAPFAADSPACGIRDHCVWFSQTGSNACATCRLVVTRAG
ncbi:hypothetical protein OK349_04810 [Sphingomonas sp. BT-65]|uniref:hypothetical protein n=1 Tax=Sphingomonas sp. BT-65 TaxID=2989821 RepID=UPI002236A5C6|nr:hypothetical protein [Sphingomonas sp. BT-65]MCW4461018.1 hypothetical protein [Sphingomonas sp. BT-65]